MSLFVKIASLLFCLDSVSFAKTIIIDGPQQQPSTKILGGTSVEFSDFTYKVSIRSVFNNQHVCSGVILTPQWILTSGTCISAAEPSDVLVRTGAHNISSWETEHEASSIILRTNTDQLWRQDLALIKLVEPIELGDTASTIDLPTRNTVPGDIGTVVGWQAAQLDNGVPLVQDGAVIGISSWFRSCGDGRPDVYTRVWSHIDWIKQQISEPEE